MRILILAPIAGLLLTGCLARTAVNVATVPFRAAGQTADWLTTSQDESDRNYGRKVRKREAQEGRERREADRRARRRAERERD